MGQMLEVEVSALYFVVMEGSRWLGGVTNLLLLEVSLVFMLAVELFKILDDVLAKIIEYSNWCRGTYSGAVNIFIISGYLSQITTPPKICVLRFWWYPSETKIP